MEPRHTEYFEGTLQLRNVTDEVINFVVKAIDKTEDTQIAKVKKVTNGFDIYVSRQRFLRSLGNKLQQRFGGQIKVSTKIHTRHKQTGRELHRVNLLFRMPNFKKGDVINYRGDEIKIISMHKKVLAKDVKTGKKLNLNFKDLFR